MSTGYFLPTSWEQAKPILEQNLQQLAAANPVGPTQAPHPPTDLIAQPGSLQVVLSWAAPQINADVAGYKVYKGNESNLFQTIADPNTKQCTISVAANTPVGLYVSSFNAAGVESAKIFVLGQSNTDQIVTAGTGGGTGGSTPIPPPRPACFSGDVEIITLRGVVFFRDLLPSDSVLTAKGTWRKIRQIHVHEGWSGMVFEWPGGGAVTADELLLFKNEWQNVLECELGTPVEMIEGTVFHVTVDTDEPEELRFSPKTERSITLSNGWRAHNLKKYSTL